MKISHCCQRDERISLLCGSRNEPLQNSIKIGFLFGTYAIAGYLTMGHALQIQGIDQLIHCEMAPKVRFVAQDEKRNTLHGWLLKEDVKLFLRHWQSLLVGGVDDESGLL